MPGLRHDVDEYAAGIVVLGGKLVPHDVNRLDLGLGGQGCTLEPIHTDHAFRTRHILDLALEFGRIVGKRVDLLGPDGRTE